MKIAVAGSHGVGKTTFAKALAKKLGFNYIHDIVRTEIVKEGFVINEKTPPEVQLLMVMRQWQLENKTHESWVADKSLLDYLVYGEIVVKDRIFIEAIRKVVRRNANYDVVFYLPIEFPMRQDGIRSNNEEFRKEVDIRYRAKLKKLGIKFIIISGSRKKRVEDAIRHINRK